jgi:MYXO-CTERM domain-containing protein
MIYWGVNGQGRDMGGHAAFISEIIKIKDAQTGQIIGYQVSVIDDKTQGDGTANNTKTTYTFNAAGALKGYGAGGRMRGFQIEMWVPEPGGMMLAAVALLALGAHSRRRA